MTYIHGKITGPRENLLIALAAIGPFHAFLVTWLKSREFLPAEVVGILTVWREILVALICVFIALEMIFEKTRLRVDWLDGLIAAFFMLGLLWLPFQWENLPQWMLGMRFDLMPLVLLFFARRVEWKKIDKIIGVALLGAAVVIIFGLLHALVLPQNFLVNFGYSMQQGPYQPDLPLSACQYLEHTDRVCRATSTFASPMRYGSYLLLVLGLLFPFMAQKSRWRAWASGLAALSFASIFLTYSRSVWIGAAALAIVALFWLIPQRARKKTFVAVLSLAALFAIFILLFAAPKKPQDPTTGWKAPPLLQTIFLRNYSTSEHWQKMKTAVEIVAEHPLGLGLGTAGPASIRLSDSGSPQRGLVTENWYLQIAVEMGVLGAVIFIAILCVLFYKFLANPQDLVQKGLFLALFGISVMGLFLHSFEETSAMLLLFGLIGMRKI